MLWVSGEDEQETPQQAQTLLHMATPPCSKFSLVFASLPYPTSESTGVLIRETTCYIVKKQENKPYKYVVLVLE